MNPRTQNPRLLTQTRVALGMAIILILSSCSSGKKGATSSEAGLDPDGGFPTSGLKSYDSGEPTVPKLTSNGGTYDPKKDPFADIFPSNYQPQNDEIQEIREQLQQVMQTLQMLMQNGQGPQQGNFLNNYVQQVDHGLAGGFPSPYQAQIGGLLAGLHAACARGQSGSTDVPPGSRRKRKMACFQKWAIGGALNQLLSRLDDHDLQGYIHNINNFQ